MAAPHQNVIRISFYKAVKPNDLKYAMFSNLDERRFGYGEAGCTRESERQVFVEKKTRNGAILKLENPIRA